MPGTGAATPGILGDRMLTDAQIRKAKAARKPYKLTDGGGLHLYVTPAGGKLWRLRYEFERKEKLLSIGPYSVVGLADARAAATDAKRLLREGRDPGVEKRLRRLGVITDGRTAPAPMRSPTTTSPVAIPTRTSKGTPAAVVSCGTASTRASPAWTARSASCSWARG
jgi:hypothetical protein